ncbi:MAG: TetR/AcrR family transcriptional regulator [Acidimicrobiales bacterium]
MPLVEGNRSEREDTDPQDGPKVIPLGRPRDPAIDEAVLAATRAVLVELGYSKLTFDLVARRAGVSRPTIYRRWPSKAHLVHESIYSRAGLSSLPDTGDFANDVRSMLRRSFASYARPEVRAALPGLIVDLHSDPALRSSVLDGLEQPVRRHLAHLVDAAVKRGDVRADIDADALFDALYGALIQRVIVRGLVDVEFADAVADLVVRGTRTTSKGQLNG